MQNYTCKRSINEMTGAYLCVVPPHVQSVVFKDTAILVDMINSELDRRHDTTTDVTLGHVTTVRKESGDVNVSFFRAYIFRSLPGTAKHSVDPQDEGAKVSGR